MHLPEYLRQAIEAECTGISSAALRQATEQLSTKYRQTRTTALDLNLTPDLAAAYVATRFPATYAAIERVFDELDRSRISANVATMLDIGSGPATAGLVALSRYDQLSAVTMIEKKRRFVDMGQRMLAAGFGDRSIKAHWICDDARDVVDLPEADLVVCAFTLNELTSDEAFRVARRAFEAARQALVIIEPGTPTGFGLVRTLREELIARGGTIVAPCPHDHECPIVDPDWCHFAARFERSSLHRRVKGGELAFEDEKFSYVVIARTRSKPAQARILRHPEKRTGRVSMVVCADTGIVHVPVFKRNRESYRRARKANWGDPWDGQMTE